MKLFYLALNGLILAVIVSASPFKAAEEQRPLICSEGSSYWCKNLVNAKSCNAVTHCIQTVWEKHVYPVDNDSICKICLDMVKQARDQLQSNETQADLKAVFEGTCELIRIKKARQGCDKLADDFVPELVEALSSQMNPQVVCSVAGLCNNAAIDNELAKQSIAVASPKTNKLFTCKKCGKVSTLISQKFKTTNRDTILENMLRYCGSMSSFSDGCSNIVLSYFNEIYNHMNANLNSENLCHMSGACSDLFHQHEEESQVLPVTDLDSISDKDDDIPCDLCKQLIVHLRDLLTANTTETEFKQVLEGLCKQTKSFKSECLSLADEYYDIIYAELTKELDPEGACFLIGICPKGSTTTQMNVPRMPLIPTKTIQRLSPKKTLGADEPQLTAQQIQSSQLPIDKLMLGGQIMNFQRNIKDTQFCTLCEYFLHFVQETLASPKNEEDIKHAVANTCNRLPKTVSGQCQSFIDIYGDAIIALLIKDIDPASLCPALNVCAKPYSNEQCPLCLFVLQEAEEVIKGNRTEAHINETLNSLCAHLPSQLRGECTDFVRDNAHALIEKLAEDYPPEQICIYIHLCTPKEEMLIYALGAKRNGVNIETNEIEDNTINGVEVQYEVTSPECMLCEQLVKEVEKKATKDKSREHIEEVLEHACESLPKEKLRQKCVLVVKKNSEYIINAIIKNVTPKEICVALAFCMAEEIENVSPVNDVSLGDGPQCVLCELVMTHLEKELADKKKIEEIEDTVLHICEKLPKTVNKNCAKFIKQYGDLIISLVSKVPPKEICTEIQLCSAVARHVDLQKAEVLECAVCHAATEALSNILKKENRTDRIVMAEKTCNILPAKYFQRCVKFMDIYFESLYNLLERNTTLSKICEEVGMCSRNEADITLGDNEMSKPQTEQEHLLGANRCTFGPSYWCRNKDQMNECNAHEFCLTKYKTVVLT